MSSSSSPDQKWTPAEDETGYLYFSNGTTSKWADDYISNYENNYVVSKDGILTVDSKNYIQDRTGNYKGFYKIMLPPPRTWTTEFKCVRQPCDFLSDDYETIYTSTHPNPITVSSAHTFTDEEKENIKTNLVIRSQYPPELVQGIINPSTKMTLKKLLQSVGEDAEKQDIVKRCFQNSDDIIQCNEDLNGKCKDLVKLSDKFVCAGVVDPELAALNKDNNASRNSIKWFQKDERYRECGWENRHDCPNPSFESQYWDTQKKQEQKLQTELNSMCKENCKDDDKKNKDEKEKKLKTVKKDIQEYQQQYCCKDDRAKTSPVCNGEPTCSTGGGKTRRYKRTTRKGRKGATRKGKTRQRTTRTGTKKVGKRM